MADLRSRARGALGRAWRGARRIAGIGRDAPVILMYHRIASPPYDPWGLCVSPERFRAQLDALNAERELLSMDELSEALRDGSPPPRATALTFDDGYVDNAAVAKPILDELRAPATMFLTTGLLGSKEPFWWDELAALVLAGSGAADFDLGVAGVRLNARWGGQHSLPEDLRTWRTHDRTADPRRLAYRHLWTNLQRLGADERKLAMQALREELSDGELLVDVTGDLPMTEQAARALPSDMISLGSHGRTHVPLPALPLGARREEIDTGRSDIAALSAHAPTGFAYPHGEWDQATRDLVIDAGFAWAVGTRPTKIDPGRHDRFVLSRVEAADCSGADLLQAIAAAPA